MSAAANFRAALAQAEAEARQHRADAADRRAAGDTTAADDLERLADRTDATAATYRQWLDEMDGDGR